MNVKFGTMEGNPARYTDAEAWWFVEEKWKWFELDAVSQIVPMPESEFNGYFPELPPLPGMAFQSAADGSVRA